MKISVLPSKISGSLRAPASKSHFIRAVAAAILAEGTSRIFYPSQCDDALAMMEIAKQFGAEITSSDDVIEIRGHQIFSGRKTFHCGESGLAARMMLAIGSLFDGEVSVTGEGSLLNRDLGKVTKPLYDLGVHCRTDNNNIPVTLKGPLQGGDITVDGSESSQFLSGLLMALPLVKNNSVLKVENLKSHPYIDLTVDVLEQFGIQIENKNYHSFTIPGNQKYHSAEIETEGDWSGSAFLFVAAAISGKLKLVGLNPGSMQADKAILSAMTKAGARVVRKESGYTIMKSDLKAFEFDTTHCPDLFPPLAVLAAYANGASKIKGVKRLFQKESNRAEALKDELGKIGINIGIEDDIMIVKGGIVKGGEMSSRNDHRIAMAGAVASLGAQEPVTIKNASCVTKSWPSFFKDLQSVGAKIIFET